MLGGWSKAEIDEEQVRNAAQYAVAEMSRRSNSLYATRMVRRTLTHKPLILCLFYLCIC